MKKPFLVTPVIPVSQPIGQFFLCSIPASALIQVAYSIPASMKRERGLFSKMFGNQREKTPQRAKQIGAYIDQIDATFPNTIILSVNYFENGSYADDEELRWQASITDDGNHIITIPTGEKLASIIDGQHRLEGFNKITNQERLNMDLPCAIFINLPRAYQAKIFATININQKRVDKSLAYELFGYDLNDDNAYKWPPDMLGVYLARILEGQNGSPFKGHVRLALLEEDDDDVKPDHKQQLDEQQYSWVVSVACLVEGVIRLVSEKPENDRSLLGSGKASDRSELVSDNAPLRTLYLQGQDKTILDLILVYFEVVQELLWKNQPEKTFITRTVGVLALFDILRDALKENDIDTTDFRSSVMAFFDNARNIDFSDDYFHASGAGRTRIKKVLKYLAGKTESSDASTAEAAKRLIDSREASTNLKI